MWVTKKILVATDFGEPSRAAAEIGLQLAQQFLVPLVLVHAYMVPGAVYLALPTMPAADYPRMYEEAARESLEKEGARLAGRGAEVITVLRAGGAWEEILATAKEVDADLIVVGTHGRRGVPRALMGSVAEKVVRLSPVPVLTIHAGPETPETDHESVC
jgi:nucleotide-binding universal stress UspA family protein